MPYYIAEIRFNRTSKDVKSERKVKKRLVTRLVTILLACLLVLTPILIIPATVGLDQSVVIEVLEDLREDVSNLPLGYEGFKNGRAAAGQRKALSNKINATINQIKAGAYGGAINKLKNDLKGTISKWVTDEYASSLIEKVDNIIELIQDIFQPPVHDIAVINVVTNVIQAHIGDSVGIDVTVVNEGIASEIFDVYVYADIDTAVIGNEITIDNIIGVSLEAEATTTLSVTWDTTSVVEGTYTISAKVPPVEGEEDEDTGNNLYIDGTVTLLPVLEHDVAVTGVSAPDEVTQGKVVTISVDAANPGDSDETFDVTVTYDATPIGTQSVMLASKDVKTVLFNWNTTGVDPDTYTITAEAILDRDEDLTNNEASTTITVKLELVLIPPVVSFTYTPDTPTVGETVIFDASASYDPDGIIVSWGWGFGDEITGTSEIVEHAYADVGIYIVTLTVTDNEGLTDTFTADVTVSPALESPVASFTENATTAFTVEVIHFDASESNDPDGTIESYFWDFGDGTNASDATVDHPYADDGTYTVTLTVTDDDGLTGSDTATKIIENRPPVALFTQSLTTVETGKTTTFYAGDSYDLDGTIVSYQWNFDDGTVVTETDLSITHVYDDDGSYTVTLTVTDDDGATNSESITKTVLNRPPIALFIQNATTVNVEEAILFDASNSSDPDGDIVEYVWDFGGERAPVKGMTVDYVYHEAGNYTVTLNVTDNDGATSTFIGEITVNAPPEIPWALFAVVGLSIAAAAATLIYLWYRRRKRKKTTTVTKPPTKPAITLYLPAKILAEPDKSS